MDSKTLLNNLTEAFGLFDNNYKAARDSLSSASDLLSDTSSSIYKRVRFMLIRAPANHAELKPAYKQEYSRFLLEFLNINDDNLYGKLKVAIIKGQVEEVKNLLRDINIPGIENPDPNDESLAIYAFGRWNIDVRKEILWILIEKGLDTKVRSENGWNLLHVFLWFFSVSTDKDHLEITKMLVRSGVPLNDVEGNLGRTPLHIAVQGHSADVVTLLIREDGIDLNKKSKSGSTPLHLAAMGDLEIVKRLLEKKDQIDMNARNDDGHTAYHIAKKYNHREEVAEYLLQNGAEDLEDPNEVKLSPEDKELMEKIEEKLKNNEKLTDSESEKYRWYMEEFYKPIRNCSSCSQQNCELEKK